MKALSATFALSLILQVRSSLGLLNSPHFHLVRFSSQNACVVRTSKKSDHDDIVTSRRVTIAPIPSDDDENGRLRRLRRLRNTYAHNREMDKLAKAGRNREAEELLLRLEEGYYEHLDPALRPDEISYNTAVHAHARARDAARAEEVLRRMSRYHREYHGRLAILSEDEEGLEEGRVTSRATGTRPSPPPGPSRRSCTPGRERATRCVLPEYWTLWSARTTSTYDPTR